MSIIKCKNCGAPTEAVRSVLRPGCKVGPCTGIGCDANTYIPEYIPGEQHERYLKVLNEKEGRT